MRQLDSHSYCYDHFRPQIPREVVDILLDVAIDVNRQNTLLDLGSGTGMFLESLLRSFHEIIAVEPDKEMMALAKRKVIPEMPPNISIRFVISKAENFMPPEGWQASLATFSRSFHLMKQPKVLENLNSIVTPDGTITIINDAPFWHGEEPWQRICRRMVEQLVSAQQLPNDGEFQPIMNDEIFEVLRQSPFSAVDVHEVAVERVWTFEKIIGYFYSTQFAGHHLFESRADGFERAIQQNLQPFTEDGRFKQQQQIQIIIARRPR